jgi:hypothetical protein
VIRENSVEIEPIVDSQIAWSVLDDNESDARLSVLEFVISDYLKMYYGQRKEQLSESGTPITVLNSGWQNHRENSIVFEMFHDTLEWYLYV